jgi:hypothetical protein
LTGRKVSTQGTRLKSCAGCSEAREARFNCNEKNNLCSGRRIGFGSRRERDQFTPIFLRFRSVNGTAACAPAQVLGAEVVLVFSFFRLR